MSGRLIELIRKANQTRRPEDSRALRAVVLGAVMTAAMALVAERAIELTTAVLIGLALPLAYWISYRRRAKDNWHIKIALTVGAIFALFRFLGQLQGVATLDEVRFPLADLFLWVQVLHGFDLPARKDLSFSLGSSLTLMAVAGSISQDTRFTVFLVIYVALVIAAMTLAHRSEVEEAVGVWAKVRKKPEPKEPRFSLGDVGRAAAVTVAAAVALFLIIPQPSGLRTFALPFSLGDGVGLFAGSGIANPGLGPDPSVRGAATSYFGFNNSLDLRVRGDLAKTLVMRVRANAPAMWRGLVFDRYDGVTWTGDESTPTPLGGSAPFAYPTGFRSLGPRQFVSQTFYIEEEQPNVIFAAGQPDSVWYDGGVSVDGLGGLRTESTLTPGTVYSVLSTRGAASPAELRSNPAGAPPADIQRRYLQVPSSLPARVGALARRITRGDTNDYDRVRSIEAYLRENYRYQLDSPVPPPGRDAVDHFLFDTDVGFCEQFASATVIMLRTLGIPARFVAGYTPGTRNPFTGYYDVRASDAHTWIEVWFPRVGWYEFDPTFDVPPATVEASDLFPLARVLEAIAGKVGDWFPDGVGGSARYAMVMLLGFTLLVGVWTARRKLGARVRRAGPALADGTAGPVTRALVRFEQASRAAGSPRLTSETAAELLARATPLEESTVEALRIFEQERYGSSVPSQNSARAAVVELDRLSRWLTARARVG